MTNYAELTRLLLTKICSRSLKDRADISGLVLARYLTGGYPTPEHRDALERLAVDHLSEQQCMACGMTRIAMEAAL